MKNKQKIIKFFTSSHLVCAKDLIVAFPEINRATIYRNLNRLLEEGAIREVEIIKDETFYELTESDHFGHFICQECGEVEELQIDTTVVEKIISKNSIESNRIQINIKGQCNKCS